MTIPDFVWRRKFRVRGLVTIPHRCDCAFCEREWEQVDIAKAFDREIERDSQADVRAFIAGFYEVPQQFQQQIEVIEVTQ